MPDNKRLRHTLALGVVASVLASSLAGCAVAGDALEPEVQDEVSASASSAVNDSSLEFAVVEKNFKLGTLPLDSFAVSSQMTRREAYLHALLSQDCLSSQGFSNVVPAPDLAAEPYSVFAAISLNEEIASVYGYTRPNSTSPADDAWADYIYRDMSDGEAAALDQCVRGIVEDPNVPKYDNFELNYATEMQNAAIDRARGAEAVRTASAAWQKCMMPVGIDDLPGSPLQMPSQSMMQRYEGERATQVDESSPITNDQISDALADSKCRQSSNFTVAMYDALWDAQSRLISENQQSLDEVQRKIRNIDSEILQMLTEKASES